MSIVELRINLGSAAMQTPYDVARALRELAEKAEVGVTEARIRDANGNTVGAFTADYPEPVPDEEA